jgi:hypothetical protein
MSETNVDALVAAGDVNGLQALATGSDKLLAKAAKKGLHVLRTRGVKVEVVRPVGPAPRAIGDVASAWTCVPDANGERLVVASLPKHGDFDMITVHVSDEKGLIQCAYGRGPRKHGQQVRKSFETSGGFAADVSVERVSAIIERAYQATLARGGSPPDDFAAARRVLPRVAPASDADHPALVLAEAGPISEETAIGLHELPTLRYWIPTPDALRESFARLEEIAQSTLFVDDAQRQQARKDELDKMISLAFDAAGRARWSRRLLDAAELFAAGGLPEDAAACATQAVTIRAEGFDPLSDPFSRHLVEKALR